MSSRRIDDDGVPWLIPPLEASWFLEGQLYVSICAARRLCCDDFLS